MYKNKLKNQRNRAKTAKFLTSTLLVGLTLFFKLSYAQKMQVLDGIEAIVNQTPILRSQVDEQLVTTKQRLRQMQMPLPDDQTLRKEVVQQIAVQESILTMAQNAGIKISDEEFMLTLENIAQNAGVSINDLKQDLKAHGISFARYKSDLIKQITISKIQQLQIGSRIQISDLEVEEFLQTSEGAKLDNREFKLAHLLLNFPENASTEQIQQVHAKIEDIKTKLEKGESFAKLARQYSNASTASIGGDLGWQKITQMPSLFATHVSQMQVGDVEGPLKTSTGLHLIQLVDKRYGAKKVFKQYKFNRLVITPNKIRDKNASLNLANSLVKKLTANGNFYALAKEYSDDLLTKQKGGFTDWILEQALPPEIVNTLKNLPEKSISQPLKTNQGWEIWQKLGTRNIDLSEEMLKSQVRELLFRNKFADASERWLNQIRQSLYIEYK